MLFTDTLHYAKQPGYISANLGEELAVLDMASGSYLGFNATAAHIWRLLDAPKTLDALVDALTGEFEVDAETCRKEVQPLLDRMAAAGLIVCNNAPAA